MEGMGNPLPAAEGMIEAEQGRKDRFHNSHCLNCNTELTDRYCPHCGQRDLPKRQTLGELIVNFISSFWSFESKFFKTGQYLLFKPGFLAHEYTEGRRERYYHPARMYVFISFVYFLLFAALPDTENPDETKYYDPSKHEYDNVFSLDSTNYKSFAEYDSVQQTLPADERHGWLRRKLQYREIELNNRYRGRNSDFQREFGEAFAANFSKVVFFLLPVFALLLKLLYIRRDFYYSEHLVFSIYYYNFFFLAGSFYMVLDLIPYMGWMAVVIGFWIVIYFLLAMKRMYKQGWAKTILKYMTFWFLFSFCILIGILINLLSIVMFI